MTIELHVSVEKQRLYVNVFFDGDVTTLKEYDTYPEAFKDRWGGHLGKWKATYKVTSKLVEEEQKYD